MAFRSRLAWLVGCIGAFAFGLAPVRAEARALELAFFACDETLAADDARRIASIELDSDAEARTALEEARIEVQCEADSATLRAAHRDTTIEKRMSLASIDQGARARLVALGIAELARDLARVLAAAPPAPVLAAPPALAPPLAAPMPPPRSELLWALTVGPQLRYETHAGIVSYGLRLTSERCVTYWLSLTLAGEVARGGRDIRGGALRWEQARLELGVRLFRALRSLRVYAEAAVAGGTDGLEGRAATDGVRGASFSAVNGNARVGLGAELLLAPHAVLALMLDTRAMFRALEARNEGEPTTTIGPWLIAATLGGGARW